MPETNRVVLPAARNVLEGGAQKPVKNEDLWRRLDELVAQHKLKYTRVAGHSGHPENDRCDELAVAACQQFR